MPQRPYRTFQTRQGYGYVDPALAGKQLAAKCANHVSGCGPDCTDIIVRFPKPGYVSKEVNPDSADVLLAKE